MKQAFIKLVLLAASAALVVSCSSSNTRDQNTGIGAVTGAVVGGLAGSAIGAGTGTAVAVGVGIVGGALIGGAIGHSMDSSDNMQANYALTNVPQHRMHHWKSHNGTHYTVIPTSKSMKMYGHEHCRKYTMIANVHGKKEKVHGVACRKANGTWESIK